EGTEIAHSDHQRAAGSQQFVKVEQRGLNLVVEQQVWQRISLADHGVERTLDLIEQMQKITLHELNFIRHAGFFGDLFRFSQHSRAWVYRDHLETQLRQRHRLCPCAARCVENTPHAAIAEHG